MTPQKDTNGSKTISIGWIVFCGIVAVVSITWAAFQYNANLVKKPEINELPEIKHLDTSVVHLTNEMIMYRINELNKAAIIEEQKKIDSIVQVNVNKAQKNINANFNRRLDQLENSLKGGSVEVKKDGKTSLVPIK